MLRMLYDMNSYGLLTTLMNKNTELMYLSAPGAISPQLFPFYKNGTLQGDCCPMPLLNKSDVKFTQ